MPAITTRWQSARTAANGHGETIKFGQLGDGTTVIRDTPGLVPDLSKVKSLAAGVGFTVALTADGVVWAWGSNKNGQVGGGGFENRGTPARARNRSWLSIPTSMDRST